MTAPSSPKIRSPASPTALIGRAPKGLEIAPPSPLSPSTLKVRTLKKRQPVVFRRYLHVHLLPTSLHIGHMIHTQPTARCATRLLALSASALTLLLLLGALRAPPSALLFFSAGGQVRGAAPRPPRFADPLSCSPGPALFFALLSAPGRPPAAQRPGAGRQRWTGARRRWSWSQSRAALCCATSSTRAACPASAHLRKRTARRLTARWSPYARRRSGPSFRPRARRWWARRPRLSRPPARWLSAPSSPPGLPARRPAPTVVRWSVPRGRRSCARSLAWQRCRARQSPPAATPAAASPRP